MDVRLRFQRQASTRIRSWFEISPECNSWASSSQPADQLTQQTNETVCCTAALINGPPRKQFPQLPLNKKLQPCKPANTETPSQQLLDGVRELICTVVQASSCGV